MPSKKHVSIRTCAVCRDKDNKRTLTRIVRTEQGVFVDLTGKQSGRGAYLCDKHQCWQRAVQTDVLQGALRVSLSVVDRDRLRQHTP